MVAIYFYLCILAIYLFLIIDTRREQTQPWMENEKLLSIFYKIAQRLGRYVSRICQDRHGMKQRTRVSDDLKILYPDAAGKREQSYLLKKLAYMLLIIFVGTILALCLSISSRMGSVDESVEYVTRGTYGSGNKEVTVLAALETEGETWEEAVTISLSEREYTEQEAYAWIDQAIDLLPRMVLAENEGFDCVTKDLKLVEKITDIPVSIEWTSDHYEWMDAKGRITATELPDEGVICMLTARVVCQRYQKESVLYVRVCPPELSYEEQLREDIKKAVQTAESTDRTGTEILLPTDVSGNKITWTRQKKDNSVIFFALALLLAVMIWPALDRDLHKKVIERNQSMARDYPELISKLVLFMGAGMTIRGAFHRIAADYEKKSSQTRNLSSHDEKQSMQTGKRNSHGEKQGMKSAYVEIVRVCHEMDSGISEGQAYLNLGKRCEDQHYVRLSMLLSQNLKKGSAGLTSLLEREAAEAFEERKRNARRYGEEAGTKLLAPMMLMLLIVMVIIMVPAFTSFGG